ncbi:hypothetical protein SKAU_G00203800 [Synaphobranchus kaupii]|uniref:Uncharacterized protein n=1 Tax=Synaphobranchus kaupii TaxID=118154 RepID=A0A9Q1FFY3_SYNKA|nr:hypothetical protein SKAU_G00203800 [Synaphobranchus kaupii]
MWPRERFDKSSPRAVSCRRDDFLSAVRGGLEQEDNRRGHCGRARHRSVYIKLRMTSSLFAHYSLEGNDLFDKIRLSKRCRSALPPAPYSPSAATCYGDEVAQPPGRRFFTGRHSWKLTRGMRHFG